MERLSEAQAFTIEVTLAQAVDGESGWSPGASNYGGLLRQGPQCASCESGVSWMKQKIQRKKSED